MKQNNSKRVAGYSRTSGGKQKDNTSIPHQKNEIERFSAANGWELIHHYVDECKTGSKIEGRDDFKRMIKDAANGQFDIIVIYDISRFARDGSDIIRECYFLKNNFGIHVIDTKGFDTRKPKNALLNFVFAGVAEDERLRIMDRTINARIANAKNGLPWSPKPPAGRAFTRTGKHNGKWDVTEQGEKLRTLLERYVNGESLRCLAKEYGYLSAQTITRKVREGQLSAGTYIARFHSPEIGIENYEVQIPKFPQIISAELEKRVRERMEHNKKCNKQHKRKYLLSGFLICSHCNNSLKGQTCKSGVYYCHNNYYADDKRNCSYRSIRAELLEKQVLDYLYNFFLDEPAYNKAIKTALPTKDDRAAIEKDIKQTKSQLMRVQNRINNLVKAIADGADVSLLLDEQAELKTQKQGLENRLNELNQTLETMPNIEQIKQQAILLRIHLIEKHKGQDWQKIDYDDVRKFLHFLFSDNPRQAGYGIFINLINNVWHITFKGNVEFYHSIINGRPLSKAFQIGAKNISNRLKKAVAKEYAEFKQNNREIELCTAELKPNNDYL